MRNARRARKDAKGKKAAPPEQRTEDDIELQASGAVNTDKT